MGAAVTPAMYDAHLLSASAAAKLIQSGELTVEHYVEALLQRIDERDEDVKAWAFLDRDQVLANARALDALAADQRGPLHGVVIGVKDVIYTKGTVFRSLILPPSRTVCAWLTGCHAQICPPSLTLRSTRATFLR